MIDTFGDI